MNCQVYILQNPNRKRYIGITTNITHRVEKHNANCSRWTSGKGPWTLLWLSRTMNQENALKLEKLLKKQKGGQGLQKLMSIYQDKL